jgi:glycosyltransferase involved in cell wall biosynthesis
MDTVKVSMIGCWYRGDMYSHHFKGLARGIRKKDGVKIRLITSNCNCFSSAQRFGIAQDELLDNSCRIIRLPYAPLEPNKKGGLIKYNLVKHSKLNYFLEVSRGASFFFSSKDADVIHFDQVLRSFGILSFAVLLAFAKMSGKKIVVTVHELDPLQIKHKSLTRLYNLTDRVLVFSGDFKKELAALGVRDEKIEVIPYAVTLEPLKNRKRAGFIFFGGHKLLKGKGFDTLLDALAVIKDKGIKTRVAVYTGKGCGGVDAGKREVSDRGLDEFVTWSEFLCGAALSEAYQKSAGCLIPFTDGSGRHPATSAMANATPIIATRKAALPEYVGDAGIFIREGAADELAEAMMRLIEHPDAAASAGARLRERAEKLFSADIVSGRLAAVYQDVRKPAAQRAGRNSHT